MSRSLRNEREARKAKHLRATEAVEALWSEQESRDATYRIASASIQDSRDEVFQIANVLPQKESSEFLEPELSQMESRQTKGLVVKHLRDLLTTAVEFHQTKAAAEQLNHHWTCLSLLVTEKPVWVATALVVEWSLVYLAR